MAGKVLTIAVPAYNASKYLDKGLQSFVCEDNSRLEVIVVNDGSTDDTGKKAQNYAERYPDVFRVINKQNGGHGSGINVAVKEANGKYFRVVDADDWVVAENLCPFMDILETTDADVLLTNYHTVHMASGVARPMCTAGIPLGCVYSLEELLAAPRTALACCTFHGVCYRTDFYRSMDLELPEKIFFEDQEYATVPFKYAKSILPLDMFFYEYLVGNAEQSVSDANQVRRLGQLEQVFWRIFDAGRGLTGASRAYFDYKLSEVLLSYYSAALIKNPNRHEGAEMAKRMRLAVKGRDVSLSAMTAKAYAITRTLHALGFRGDTLEKLKCSKVYMALRRLAH